VNSQRDRSDRHAATASALTAMSDAEMVTLLESVDGTLGIGGTTRVVPISDVPVFVKLVSLTDLERRAGPGCTSNLFELPTFYQYGVGVGSSGFNVWREVAVHEAATTWVVAAQSAAFPLLHHWRELQMRPTDLPADRGARIEGALRFWNGSAAVRRRLESLAGATTVIALFIEHVPFTLRPWLTTELVAGRDRADTVLTSVEPQLLTAVAHLRSEGITHFDAHFDNVLTDGHQLMVADFGLATAHRFDLSPAERTFFEKTSNHDTAYCVTALVNTVVTALCDLTDAGERNRFIARVAASHRVEGLAGRAEDVVLRFADVATIVNDFYWRLHNGTTAEYPAGRISAALGAAGLDG
jgi:hypothetical protein